MTDREIRRRATADALAVLANHKKAGTLRQAIDALGVAPSPSGQFWRINLEAILFWREFVKASGITLDPNLWHVDRGAAAALAKAIEGAIVNGWSGSRAASDFLYAGEDRGELFRVELPERNDIWHEVWEHLDHWFWREVNRANLAVQVSQGIASPAELAALDDTDVIPPPPFRAP